MKVEVRDYPRQRERKGWDRFLLLECLHDFIIIGGVTLMTGGPDLLPGVEDGVGWLPNMVVKIVEGFVPRFLGWRRREGKRGGGEGSQEKKSRG